MHRYFIADQLVLDSLGVAAWVLNLITGKVDQSLLLSEWRHPSALLGFHILNPVTCWKMVHGRGQPPRDKRGRYVGQLVFS